jgi:hypothetical protein
MRMLKQNHIKLVTILFLNDEVQTNLYLYIRNKICTSLHMTHSRLKYPIVLLSENVQESIIGGLGLLLNFILVYKANATMSVVKYHSMSILHELGILILNASCAK